MCMIHLFGKQKGPETMSNKIIGYKDQLWRVEYEFTYTGEDQPFTLEPGEYLCICHGAHGGKGIRGDYEYGGVAYGVLHLDETTTLHAVVGGNGGDYNADGVTPGIGGFNGGACGGLPYNETYCTGAGGGGASDIRLLPYDADEYPTYDDQGNMKHPTKASQTYGGNTIDTFEQLADGYVKCDCIVSSANAQSCFNLPYMVKPITSIEIIVEMDTIQPFPGYAALLGVRQDTSSYTTRAFGIAFVSTNQWYFNRGDDQLAFGGIGATCELLGKKIKIVISGNTASVYNMQDTLLSQIVSPNTISQNCNAYLALFGNNMTTASVPGDFSCGKFYNMIIREDDVIVHHYVPCIRCSDLTSGIYDTIEQTFLTTYRVPTTITSIPHTDSFQQYTALDYIYAWGYQHSAYINTNYIPKSNTKIEIDCVNYLQSDQPYKILFGTRKGNYQSNAFVFFTRFNGANSACYNRSGVETIATDAFLYNERIKLVCYRDKAEWFLNGITKGSITTTGTINDCISPLFINTTNTSSTVNGIQSDGSYASSKIYDIKIYEVDQDTGEERLVRHFVPVLRNEDHEPGLFEMIQQSFHPQGNSTSNFYWVCGPPKYEKPSLCSRIMVAGGGGGGTQLDESRNQLDGFSFGGGVYGGYFGTVSSDEPFYQLGTSYSDGYAFGYGCQPHKRLNNVNYSQDGAGGGGGGWYGGYASITTTANSVQNRSVSGGGGSGYVLTDVSYRPTENGSDPSTQYHFTNVFLSGAIAIEPAVYICKPTSIQSNDIVTFPCVGRQEKITLPSGQYRLACWGGDGGYRYSQSHAKRGGYSEGKLTLAKETDIFVNVAGSGGPYWNLSVSTGTNNLNWRSIALPTLAFNGGGTPHVSPTSTNVSYLAGGGASDIRVEDDTLNHRVIVAGGAGSEGGNANVGGSGGGITGEACQTSGSGTNYGPGTQTESPQSGNIDYAGGFGYGGSGTHYGGSGGGGWYGGCGVNSNSSNARGGAGGSGFVWTSLTVTPEEYALNDAYQLTEAFTSTGANNLPLQHTQVQIECMLKFAKCICHDKDGYKYFDTETNAWSLLDDQRITPETFSTYGQLLITDTGLDQEYDVYLYDEDETISALGLEVVPTQVEVVVTTDTDIQISEVYIDDKAYNKSEYRITTKPTRIKNQEGNYVASLTLLVDKLQADGEAYKVYSAQLFSRQNKQSHEYLKLDQNGRRLFKHYQVNQNTGEITIEERTMALHDPEQFRDELGQITVAQSLLPVGNNQKLPIHYDNTVIDPDVTTISNTMITEYDRTIYVAMAVDAKLVIKAMSLMSGEVTLIHEFPWNQIVTNSTNKSMGGFLVDEQYFYLCLAVNNNNILYQQALLRIDRITFAISHTPTSGDRIQAFGKIQWYDDHTICCVGTTSIEFYDTQKLAWTRYPITSISISDFCIGKQIIVCSYGNHIYVYDLETHTIVDTFTVKNNYYCRICYHDGVFYLVQNNYLYLYDERTRELTKEIIISPMVRPCYVEYVNGAIIATQYNSDQLIVYQLERENYILQYLPWATPTSDRAVNYLYQPFAMKGYFFFLYRTLLTLNYRGESRYDLGYQFSHYTVYFGQENVQNLMYDERFVTVLPTGITVHDGTIEYPLSSYDRNHIAHTHVKKADYRILKGSTFLTNRQ